VAAPVLDVNGTAVAAVAVQGPALRLTDDRLPAVADRIAEATKAIAPVLAATG
jgi:IclR family transcriptional regulator, acetate operon repressor